MRLCLMLRQQHAGEMFVKHWKIQRKKSIRDTGALKELDKRGIQVIDAANLIFPWNTKQPQPTIESFLECYEPKPLDPSECYLYSDKNVLLGGLDQAKVLTNTIEPAPGCLPQSVMNKTLTLPDNIDDFIIKCLKSSLIFEVEQKKLPVRKDPERPAWNFPRDFGITDRRRNKLLSLRLLEICSKLSRCLPVMEETKFTISLERCRRPVTLSLRSDALVLSEKTIEISDPVNISDVSLPNISPLQPTISIEVAPSLPEQHPLTGETKFKNIQLAISHYNETEVSNIYETSITTEQFLGRSLLKGFTFAAAHAKYLYGSDVLDLPKPLTIPCVHTDSKRFHFSIYQLKTLREDGQRNYFWSLPIMELYSECKYIDAIPTVNDFNPDVFKMLFNFYNL